MTAAAGAWRGVDWAGVRWALVHCEAHYREWEIDRLDMEQLARALDFPDGKKRPPGGAPDLGAEGVVEAAKAFRAMTPEQRLDAAMARRK